LERERPSPFGRRVGDEGEAQHNISFNLANLESLTQGRKGAKKKTAFAFLPKGHRDDVTGCLAKKILLPQITQISTEKSV
jgi:hypothetical protein